jgi:protein MpaA
VVGHDRRVTVRRALLALLITAPLLALVSASPGVATGGTVAKQRALVEARTIGHTVRGRTIRAYRVGDPKSPNKVLVMSTMHGNEPATRAILSSIRDGRPVHGIDLWLIPQVNPDGLARHTRKNVHGVDLNRNFPYHWVHLNGSHESGSHAASEPETRALMRFAGQIKPKRIVSFHQPLHGVDVSTPESRHFARRLASALHLPQSNLTCGGVCHGTFTQWYMHRYSGVAVTVEYGAHPTHHRMNVTAPRELLQVLGATR